MTKPVHPEVSPALGSASAQTQERLRHIELPRWDHDRFDVPADTALLQRLIDDMAAHAGALAPAECWRLPDASTFGSFEGLLGDWCGSVGRLALDEQLSGAAGRFDHSVLAEGMAYLAAIDHTGVFAGVPVPELGRAGWRVFDYSSATDLLLITAFFDWPAQPAQILEVGGGFGRFPEFLWRAGLRDFRYVNIDAVPASLMWCAQYLRHRCPDRKVLVFLDDEASRKALDDGVDFLIVPSWHADKALGARRFDLALNVEGFQEMNQSLVDHFVQFFDARVRTGGCVYLMNARDYLFKGEYRYPTRWERLFHHHTLRSWSGDQPTEIFRVGSSLGPASQQVREYFYRRELGLALQDPRRRKRLHG